MTPQSSSATRPEDRHDSDARWFTLTFPPTHAADAEQMGALLDEGIACLGSRAQLDVAGALGRVRPVVIIHAAPNDRTASGHMTLITGVDPASREYRATIHALALSAHAPGGTTVVGEPYDANYVFKTLVHEYSAVVLDRTRAAHPAGWQLYSAPAWFYQGYAEYLALQCSSEHARTITQRKYLKLAASNEEAFADAYVGGFARIAFLHDRFGSERAAAVLRADHRDFWSSMSDLYVLDEASIARETRTWLTTRTTGAPER